MRENTGWYLVPALTSSLRENNKYPPAIPEFVRITKKCQEQDTKWSPDRLTARRDDRFQRHNVGHMTSNFYRHLLCVSCTSQHLRHQQPAGQSLFSTASETHTHTYTAYLETTDGTTTTKKQKTNKQKKNWSSTQMRQSNFSEEGRQQRPRSAPMTDLFCPKPLPLCPYRSLLLVPCLTQVLPTLCTCSLLTG